MRVDSLGTRGPVERLRGEGRARLLSVVWFPALATAGVLGFDLAVLLVVSPGYGAVLGSWDGRNFLDIAARGYPATPARTGDGVITDPRWAFYPVFPLLLRGLVTVTGLGTVWAVPVINGLALAAAMTVFFVLCRRFVSTAESRAAVLLTLTGMAMPVALLAYSESIALLLLMVVFAALSARAHWSAALTILVLSLTRPVVAPLAVVLVVGAVDAWRRRSSTGRSPWPWVGLAAWAGACAFMWPTIAGLTTGRWSTYWDTEAAYQEPGMARSWLAWAAGMPPLGLVVAGVLLVVLVWAAVRALPSRTALSWRAWLVAYPAYVGAVTLVSGATVRLLLPTFPAALLVAPLARTRAGQLLIGGLCAVGLVLQVVWITRFVVPSRGFVP